ncbi:SH3 domain-containing protein [Candidatus Sulfurimonas baltica]|uniref:SH3 domain-containing protein n=1 Tax=Candidatus Sulfurimonas baltica TaxID=2740404 RepID=A0A7S7LZE3_9BACT|nr:SH3 domain-containing protein [Candidatus Sulfurimonas baltica]QOY53344.1 SH3 domain-containing protein [Candidatus Sulfurimonas baltica]
MKYIYIVLFVLLFTACSTQKLEPQEPLVLDENKSVNIKLVLPKKDTEIHDLKNIPQDVDYFLKNINSSILKYDVQEKYESSYFSVWNIDKPKEDVESAKWPFFLYKAEQSYGENLQPLKQEFFDNMLESANFGAYATVNLKAVTLRETNIRAFPTIRPLLLDPTLAGEGFPFDYMQNSTVHANKPLFISHYSKDMEWVYVLSSFASGWVKTSDIVILGDNDADIWQKAQQIQITKENVPIYTIDGRFLFKSRLGMMFALISQSDNAYTILTISSYKDSKPLFTESIISKDIASRGVISLNQNNLGEIVREVSKTNYGWGGMYEQRDCSSMLRDMFAPFGIWLPRNSYQQSKIGKVIAFNGMSDDDKIKLIKDKGIAFETLLYKKGHIVLYVGTYNDEVIVFHNTWGIKTKKDGVEGRVIIGKPIFSTLRLGKNQENYDEEAEILKNLKSMNILTQDAF